MLGLDGSWGRIGFGERIDCCLIWGFYHFVVLRYSRLAKSDFSENIIIIIIITKRCGREFQSASNSRNALEVMFYSYFKYTYY